MFLIIVKFLEVFGRAGFVIATSYTLSLAGAGQFGVVVTLIGFFAFLFNWERQIDIQRRHVDSPDEVFDRAVVSAMQFWGFNQALMLPVLLVVCRAMAGLDTTQLALVAVIASCEHVANQTYQLALISPRYVRYIVLVAAKNIAVMLAIAPFVFMPGKLTLDIVLIIWAIGQVICAAVVLTMWSRMQVASKQDEPFSWRGRIFAQHRASFTHFLIGLVAMGAMQLDRLLVGALLPIEQVGLYFRHVVIVSSIYQFFNVAFYNRALPTLFSLARQGDLKPAQWRIMRELTLVSGLIAVGFASAIAIDAFTGHQITQRTHLSVLLATVLVAGALVRIAGDFFGAICNALFREKLILRAQIASLAVSAATQLALAGSLGALGIACGTLAGASIYFAMVIASVASLKREQKS